MTVAARGAGMSGRRLSDHRAVAVDASHDSSESASAGVSEKSGMRVPLPGSQPNGRTGAGRNRNSRSQSGSSRS